MPLESDVTINNQKLSPDSVPESLSNGISIIDFLAGKLDTLSHIPILGEPLQKWHQIDPKDLPSYRLKKTASEQKSIPFFAPLPDQATGQNNIQIPSRDSGRSIPCRLRWSSDRSESRECKGAILHMHGGGFVLGDESSQDKLLQMYADTGDLAVVSVGYRLAPEHPFPAASNDCFDVGQWLIENAEERYGGPLRFIGGESGGAHLSMLTTLHLVRQNTTFKLAGIIQHFGSYSMVKLPSCLSWDKSLILSPADLDAILAAFLPTQSFLEKQDPSVSPLNDNLEELRGRLPAALFTCGTVDPLLDDTLFMGMKWLVAGGEGVVKIYPGAVHGFIAFSEGVVVPGVHTEPLQVAVDALADTRRFIQERMDAEVSSGY